MGKSQKKTGKGRLDKYYKLAKEQGYRARSAFKLIQLNKKYNFLESARCCIDLCAAPGGWLQVASKYMPVNSVIIGVDLVPIKPIPRVVTFASDITTPQCRNLIRAEVKDWKADVVLHDGAPNLVLMSLKLAVEFLVKGGTFVTKVFRSADYNNLIWVFNQLFGKVEAIKPPSFRNVSAEIFVVCREFLAPKFIDPKFLDPKHVFKDLSTFIPDSSDKPARAHNAEANVFQPEKKRRKRDGYEDGNYTLFKSIPVSELIHSTDPISVLGSANKITFQTDEEKEWLKFEITSGDVKANCDDLKVLGKGDFKALIKWRVALREELGLDVKRKDTEDATETVQIIEEADEEQMIQDELERSNAENVACAKRDRRRANEIRNKTIQRMQLQMTAPMDIGLELQDASLGGQDDFFDLQGAEKGMRKRGGVSNLIGTEGVLSQESDVDNDSDNASDEEILDSEEEWEKKTRGLENELDGMYDPYRKHGLTTAEAVTLAQQLVNCEKTKTRLINDGFNRYSLNAKDGLPSWFLDDETKHYKPNIPVTKEAIAVLRAKQRALDARLIKKIAEAKAWKKYKAAQKLEKAMKKAEGVNDTSDMSESSYLERIQQDFGVSFHQAQVALARQWLGSKPPPSPTAVRSN
ncbi:rRNA methyltransferase Spb1 [Lentinula edodes]|nr:rRNA methyltransferase Spb1 [Lentinula edodes]